jgi:hypothetical protein
MTFGMSGKVKLRSLRELRIGWKQRIKRCVASSFFAPYVVSKRSAVHEHYFAQHKRVAIFLSVILAVKDERRRQKK